LVFLLSHLIDRAADRAADREAFCDADRGFSYGQLVDRANRLAHLLVEDGVRRGDRVGIHMPRCLDSAVAIYGTLKAGASYVPLDPQTPAGGLAQLVSSCEIRHLISHETRRAAVEELARRNTPLESVIGFGTPLSDGTRTHCWSALASFSGGAAPDRRIMEQDMAYIMFSSGSTGRPKGIVHTHASGLAYASRSAEVYGVTPDDRIANHSPLHFDMSTFGYLTGPFAGATTLLIPEPYAKIAASLSQLIERERITIWYSVPLALIQLLLRGVLESRDLRSIRWVLFGGEPFPVKHLRTLMERWPDASFSNVYGPAEVNQCTYYHVPRVGADGRAPTSDEPIPIGRVWENAEGLVVDEEDRAAAAGVAGELLVRTPTMMRGYWRRPDLNAAAFFRRSADSGSDDVFYRTGDLVRERPDGELEFLGRKDRQLKMRGYRIELDDIEHVLTSHASVEAGAAYPVRVDGAIDHVEAAIIPSAGEAVDSEELRGYLSDLLSWYAVPAKIHVLDDLPRTTSGKIDRRRLQSIAEEAPGQD
jgi:amino acid adenylation domain-containing protein